MVGLFGTDIGMERSIMKYAGRAAHLDAKNRAVRHRIRKLESAVHQAIVRKNEKAALHYIAKLKRAVTESISLHSQNLEDLEYTKRIILWVEAHKLHELEELESTINSLKSKRILSEKDARHLQGSLDSVKSALHSRLSIDKRRESRLKTRAA